MPSAALTSMAIGVRSTTRRGSRSLPMRAFILLGSGLKVWRGTGGRNCASGFLAERDLDIEDALLVVEDTFRYGCYFAVSGASEEPFRFPDALLDVGPVCDPAGLEVCGPQHGTGG